jgi:hypothetical protein
MGKRAVLLIAAAIAASGQAGTAAAQSEPVVVAGGLPGPTLAVADISDRDFEGLAVTVGAPGGAEPLLDVESGNAPLWPNMAIIEALPDESLDGAERVFVGGAVNAGAAEVEIGFRGGFVLRLPTLAGEAYTGRYAGRVRFFLGEITLRGKDTDDDPATVRMFDAAGAVIGADEDESVSRSQRVLRRRAGGALVRAEAVLTSQLDPMALAPEHRSDDLCMTVAVQSADDEPEIACQDPDELMSLGGRRGCGRLPTTLAGFVPADTSTLTVRLGSGRTVSLPARPAAFGKPGRMVAAVLPRGEGIRSASALDANGRRLARGALLVAPPDRRCPPEFRAEDWRYYGDAPARRPGMPPGTELAAALAGDGAHRLLVRDSGEQLCVGIDQLDLDGSDCGKAPFDADDSRYLYSDPERGFAVGIYPAQVAAVDIHFRGGGSVRAPATQGIGYTGRYRAAVHFLLTPIASGQTVERAVMLDAAGRELGAARPDGPGTELKLVGRPSTALAAGPVRVIAGAHVDPASPGRFPCVGLLIGRKRGPCNDEYFSSQESTVTTTVPCDPRRTIVYGIVRSGVKRVEVTLAGGRRVDARLAAFPRGLGIKAKVFLAVLDRRVAVTRVRLAGPRKVAGTVALPGHTPARQCGYEVVDTVY